MFVKIINNSGKARCIIKHVVRPDHVVPGVEYTKEKRLELFNIKIMTGTNSMVGENYQRMSIEEGTGIKCPKSGGMRINSETYELAKNPRAYFGPNASYDWTEDFDGLQTFGDKCRVFYNFKSTVENGGSQTRTLRCVYDFIKAQRNFIRHRTDDKNIFFMNILDGKVCTNNMDKFSQFKNEEQIYVGDLYSCFEWLNSKLETIL